MPKRGDRSARAARRTRNRLRLGDGATLVLLALVLFPFVWLVQMSFRPNTDILGYELAFTPTLAHYRALWTGAFPGSFVNSLVTSTASTALALLIGVPAAYSLSRAGFGRPATLRCGSSPPAWRRRSPSPFRSSSPIASSA